MSDAVMAMQKGVQVTAQSAAWPGPVNIETDVTPLRIIVRNRSPEPLQIVYSGFIVTAGDGTSFSAIPPRHVGGVLEGGVSPRSAFAYSEFHVAPYYSGYYPQIDAYRGPFLYDADYYDTHYEYWESTRGLPTPEMLARALPEGVLEGDGSLDGYVYFEKIERGSGRTVILHTDLLSAYSGQRFVSLQMPFVLD